MTFPTSLPAFFAMMALIAGCDVPIPRGNIPIKRNIPRTLVFIPKAINPINKRRNAPLIICISEKYLRIYLIKKI